MLYLPNHYASAWVIDGQHRLYGYVYSKRMEKGPKDKTTFPVLAYENLPPLREAELFVDINSRQERVSQNLIKEIYANLKWASDDEKEKMNALLSRIALRLNSVAKSPFYERLALSSTSKTHVRCLTLTSLVDGLNENKFFGDFTPVFKPGPFYATKDIKREETIEKACDLLIYYFDLFKNATPQQWLLGDEKGGFLFTNNGIRSLLIVLKEIFAHIQLELQEDLDELPSEKIVGHLDKYVVPLTHFFVNSSPDLIERFRKRQALAGVNQNATELMSFIHNEINGFCPERLKNYLDTVDEVGTGEARGLIDEIQITIFNYTVKKLKEQFGNDWWFDGIPMTIRTFCVQRQEEEKGIKAKEQYLHLIDYKEYCFATLGRLFEKAFSMTKTGSKEKRLKWLDDLNTIRNITHHREKWPATKDQVKLVRDVHRFVKENFRYEQTLFVRRMWFSAFMKIKSVVR